MENVAPPVQDSPGGEARKAAKDIDTCGYPSTATPKKSVSDAFPNIYRLLIESAKKRRCRGCVRRRLPGGAPGFFFVYGRD